MLSGWCPGQKGPFSLFFRRPVWNSGPVTSSEHRSQAVSVSVPHAVTGDTLSPSSGPIFAVGSGADIPLFENFENEEAFRNAYAAAPDKARSVVRP